jgi:hypothetical protein
MQFLIPTHSGILMVVREELWFSNFHCSSVTMKLFKTKNGWLLTKIKYQPNTHSDTNKNIAANCMI